MIRFLSIPGGRTAKEIVAWVNQRAGNEAKDESIVTFTTAEEISEWALGAQNSDPETPVIRFLGMYENAGGEEVPMFEEAAKIMGKYAEFALVHNRELFKNYDIDQENAVVAFKPFDDKIDRHIKDWRTRKLTNFMWKNLLPAMVVPNP